MSRSDPSVLDRAAWAALAGPHLPLAERRPCAARYPADVSPFAAVDGSCGAAAWRDLAELVGTGEVALSGEVPPVPDQWEVLARGNGVQLVDEGLRAEPDPEAVVLTVADVPDMLDLVSRTRPGPFLPRTVEMGTYLGIRHEGALVAMAGERLHPPGWTEISAVCTDGAHAGQGLATRLVRAVAAGIRARGETPFLHAAATNTRAIGLYEHLGFRLRRETSFCRVRLRSAATGV